MGIGRAQVSYLSNGDGDEDEFHTICTHRYPMTSLGVKEVGSKGQGSKSEGVC